MKHESKLNPSEQQYTTELNQGGEQLVQREFASAEELIRHDAAQVSPPPTLLARLKVSLAEEAKLKGPWWRRWFSHPSP